MDTGALRALLATKLGLASDAVGPSFLTAVAGRCLAASGHATLEALVDDAHRGGRTWDLVREQVLVRETWFFRDRAPFERLPAIVRDAWGGPGTSPVRILSCPCSTGEEPYSAAMALLVAGLPVEAFRIEAADLSTQALDAARTGIFGPGAFRGATPWDRSRFFTRVAGLDAWQLEPACRGLVTFREADLLSGRGLEMRGAYDVVLCRNVLIYLHDEARARVLATVRALLRPGGVLVVGHAEGALAVAHGLAVHGTPDAFAFVAGSVPAHGPAHAKETSTPDAHPRRRTPQATAARRHVLGAPRRPRHGRPSVAPAAAPADDALTRAQQLGDQGRTEAALDACRAHLAQHPTSAEGYYLLGVLSSALGQTEAATAALRRALYLEAGHTGALLHLAVMQASGGDVSGAARLRRRAAARTETGR